MDLKIASSSSSRFTLYSLIIESTPTIHCAVFWWNNFIQKQILLSVLFCVRLCKWIELNTQWASTKMFSRIWQGSEWEKEHNARLLLAISWLLIILWFYYSRFVVYWVPPICVNNNWLDNYRISRDYSAAATF